MLSIHFRAAVSAIVLVALSACGGEEAGKPRAPGSKTIVSLPVAKNMAISGVEDQAIQGTLVIPNNEASRLTYKVVERPANGKLSLAAAGTYQFEPDANWNGTDTFTYRIGNGEGWSKNATVTITVDSVNDRPAITGVVLTGAPFVFGSPLTADPIGWSDVDGDASGYQYKWTVNGVVVSASARTLPGTYAIKGNTIRVSVTPFDGTATGSPVASSLATVGNSGPTALSDGVTTPEDVATTNAFAADDADTADTLTIEIVSQPSAGAVTFPTTLSYTYTPAANTFGNDSFSYRVSDGTAWSNPATISLTVSPVNDAPTLTGAMLSGGYQRGVTAFVAPQGFADLENGVAGYFYRWSVNGANVPMYGAVLPATYVTKGNVLQAFATPFDGTDAGAEVASNVITVGNTMPLAATDAITVNENGSVVAALLASDVDSDALTYQVVSQPARGSVALSAGAAYTYTPESDWFGGDSFSYRVSDGTSWSNTATVQTTVNMYGEAPYGQSIIPGPLADAACNISGLFTITAITPDPAVQLTPGSVVTFTATVRYSITVADSLRLQMTRNSFTTITAPLGEAVAISPVAGCAETTVSFSNVTIPSDSGAVFVGVVSAVTGTPKGAGVRYLTGAPSIRIAATNQSPSDPIVLSADGTASLKVKYTWENIPASPAWRGLLTTDGVNFLDFSLPTTEGSEIYTVTTRPDVCSTKLMLVHAYGFPISGSGQIDQWVQFLMDIPSLLSVYTRTATQTLQTPVSRSITVRNCSTATQYVSVSSSDAWIYPMAASTAIAPSASANVTFATNINSLALGMYSGNISITPVNASANTLVLPFRLAAASSKPYAADVTAYSWVAETAAAVQLAQAGEDEAVHVVNLPFSFSMYGVAFTQASVLTNGYIRFDQPASSEYSTAAVPTTKAPWSIFVHWADLVVEAGQTISSETVGTAPNRRFVVTWNNVSDYNDTNKRRTAQVIFYEGSAGFLVQYALVNATARYGINMGNGAVGSSWAAANDSAFWVAPNYSPIAAVQSIGGNEDTVITSTFQAIDADTADTLTPAVVALPAHGDVAFTSGLGYTYTPDADWNGTDTFTYRVSDGHVVSNTATVTVTVDPVNDVPELSTATLLLAPYQAGATAFVSAAGWYDVEGTAESYIYRWEVNGIPVLSTANPLPGIYAVKGNLIQAFVAPFDGTDIGGEVASAVEQIINTAPMAGDQTATTFEDMPVTASFAASDADAADSLTINVLSGPSNGTLTFPDGSSFTYTPYTNTNGVDSFTYRVNDGTANSNIATVSLIITAANDRPVYSNLTATTQCAPAEVVAYQVDATDTEGEVLTYSSTAGTCGWTTFTPATRTISGTCIAMNNGCSVDVTVSDGTNEVTRQLKFRPNQARYVATVASGLQDGTSWNDATTSVQAAATALAGSGGSVWIKQGTYRASSTASLVVVPSNVNLYGGFDGSEAIPADRVLPPGGTVLSGDSDNSGTHTAGDAYHVVQAHGTSRLDGLTITLGNAVGSGANQYGGGFYSFAGNVTLDNVVAENNHAGTRGGAFYFENAAFSLLNSRADTNSVANAGGGIYARVSSGLIQDVNVSANTASVQGAGMAFEGNTGLTVTDTTISNNVSGNHSGAILFNGGSVYTLGNLTVSGNSSSSQAGAIFSWATPVNIYASVFTDNTTPGNGGALAIYSNSNFNLYDTSVSKSSGGTGGAVYASGSTLSLLRSTLSYNTSTATGGSVYATSASQLIFIDSNVERNTGGTFGGGMLVNSSSKAAVTNTTFVANKCTLNNGGAVYLDNATLDLDSSSFTGNGTVAGGTNGGAIGIVAAGKVTAVNSTFESNTSTGAGGAIYVTGTNSTISLTGSMVKSNASGGGAGISIASTGILTDNGSTFKLNTAGSNGGAINLTGAGASGTLTNTRLESNTAGNGGAAYVATNAQLTDNTSTFTQNAGANGGAVYLIGGGKLTGNGSTFQQNAASTNGGAMYVDGTNSQATLTQTVVNANTGYNGAGVYVTNAGNLSVSQGEFDANLSGFAGGAIYLINANTKATISASTFTGNKGGTTTGSNGGAILATASAALIVDGSTFEQNTANSGGALYLTGASTRGTLSNLLVKNNASTIAGGGAMVVNGTTSITGSTFAGNTGSNGAGLAFGTTSKGFVTDSTFTGNIGTGQGAGIYASTSAYLFLSGSVISGNTGTNGAGLAILSSSTGYVTNTTIQANMATGLGGGMYASSSSLTVTGATIAGNTTTLRGGGLGQQGGTVKLYYTTVTGNTATSYGGGLWGDTSPKLTIVRSKITSNISPTEGGAIKVDGATLTIADSLVAWNKGGFNGAIVRMWAGAAGFITNTTFAYNKATVSVTHGVISYTAGTVTLTNSILHSNTANNFHTQGGTLTANYNCSDTAITGTGNVTEAPSPFVYADSSELFLNQASACLNIGDAAAADTGYGLVALDWRNLTTDISTSVLESAGTVAVDAGYHFDPTHAWIETFDASSGSVNWAVSPGAAYCLLSNSFDGLSEVITGADLPVGNRAVAYAAGTTMTLTCQNTYPKLAAVATVAAQQ